MLSLVLFRHQRLLQLSIGREQPGNPIDSSSINTEFMFAPIMPSGCIFDLIPTHQGFKFRSRETETARYAERLLCPFWTAILVFANTLFYKTNQVPVARCKLLLLENFPLQSLFLVC